MNILDENITSDQRSLLKKWRIGIRQIGYEIGRKGLQAAEIIPLLHQVRHPTFFIQRSLPATQTFITEIYAMPDIA